MRLRYTPSPALDRELLQETVRYLLMYVSPQPGQTQVSNDALPTLARERLMKEHVAVIEASKVWVNLEDE